MTFELRLGPLWLHFSMGDPQDTEPEREYVPAAQVERADQPLTELGPDQYEGRIGFRA